jgi:hypothetical protein
VKRFVTRALIVVAAILGIVFAQVAPASATPASAARSDKLESNLAALWTTVLETPADQNPFTNPEASACWYLDHRTVAPFAGGDEFSCTVRPGTKIFVVGSSFECSTFDNDCGRQDPGGCHGTTAAELLQCARDLDPKVSPTVTVDGKSVTQTAVETAPLNIVLPDDNIFGEPPGTPGLSVAHGWVTLLNPLTPGTHTIMISSSAFPTNTTTIVVTPGH